MDAEQPMTEETLEPRRCTAISKNSGERCQRAPILGGMVCAVHGGSAPQVMAKARERLVGMVEPAMVALHRAVTQTPPCPLCGRSDSDRDPAVINAARIILDRTGFGPSSKLEVTPGEITITKIERIIVYPDGTRKQLDAPAVEGYLLPEDDADDPLIPSTATGGIAEPKPLVHHEDVQFPTENDPPPPVKDEVKP